jgi:hypothetical protein
MVFNFALVSSRSSACPRGYAASFNLPAASLLGKERVSARLGWEGEMGHFEYPEGYACLMN